MKKPLLVGYLESWQPNTLTFSQAAENGYTTIVLAFGTILGTSVGIAGGSFYPCPTPELLKADMAQARALGAQKLLLSVGGEHNTYNPNGSPAQDVAQSIVNFLHDYKFDGIDFDLEIQTDGNYLDQLCAAIRSIDSSLLITAAPQLNQADRASDIFLVSTSVYRIYDQAVQNGRFDYLFIQAYNNGWPQVNGKGEKDVAFISEAFKNLKKSIPTSTLITIGEPASAGGAGETSVYYGPDQGPDIYTKMAAQYRSIANDPQFGGIMTWDINWDQKNNYQFVKGMQGIIN